jgi:hypothetical protein
MLFTIGWLDYECQSMTLGSGGVKITWRIYAPKPFSGDVLRDIADPQGRRGCAR